MVCYALYTHLKKKRNVPSDAPRGLRRQQRTAGLLGSAACGLLGKIMGKSWENLGKFVGNWWNMWIFMGEIRGKLMGHRWKNDGFHAGSMMEHDWAWWDMREHPFWSHMMEHDGRWLTSHVWATNPMENAGRKWGLWITYSRLTGLDTIMIL